MITDSAREATLSRGVFAALMARVAVATLTSPAHTNNGPYEWVVYSLSSGGEEGAVVPGMSVWLNNTSMDSEAPHSLAAFTVCVWFKATTFLGFSTLLSYSLASNELPNGIEFRIHPNKLLVTYMEQKFDVALKSTLTALEWYPMCLVVEPDGLSVWVDRMVDQRYSASTSPLPLDGLLVLGQDKDALGGGYTSDVSFLGEVTGLSLWNVTLTPQHLQDWASCTTLSVEPLLPWNNFKWTIHNQTGVVSQHGKGPCTHDALIKDKLFLFSEKMTRQDAQQFLWMVGLELVIPRSDDDVEAISALLESNRDYCTTGGRRDPASWLGVEFHSATGKFVDAEGQEFVYLDRDIRRNQDSSYIMQNDRGQWETVNENTKLCFIGNQRMKKVVFRLRGLCEEDDSDLFNAISTSFVLAAHEEDVVYLHGYGHMHIRKDLNTSQWCLRREVLNGDVACVTSGVPPIGHNEWTLKRKVCDASIYKQESLILTICTEEQFTCPDSSCIDLARRCDMRYDCKDRSDEVDCITALLPSPYLHSLPPNIPLWVMAEVFRVKMTTFDIISMTFHMNLELKFRWYDPRITFAHLASVNPRAVITERDGLRVWRPEFTVTNTPSQADVLTTLEVERFVNGTPSLKGYLYSGGTNPLVITVSVKSTVYCDFELRWYPWDDQHCFVNLKVTNVPSFGLSVDGSSTVTMCPELLEEYEVVECRLQEEPHPTNNLTLLVHLTRRYQYHLWTTFLPTSLLAALGYGTLLLPLEAFAERGSMSLTTLLMFIALYTETSSSLPSTAYLKHIDVWFVFSLVFLSLVITIHLMTFLAGSESAGPGAAVAVVCPAPPPGRHLTHISAPSFTKRVRDETAVPKRILRMSTVLFALVFIVFTLVYFLAII